MDYFTWDEDKRVATIGKHGIDFIDAAEIFASDYLELSGKSSDEERYLAIGPLNETMIAVVYTIRGSTIRIITARRARRNEREAYEKQIAGRASPNERPD